MTLSYELNINNMNKYFMEYLKKQIYICFDGEDGFVNLKFDYNGNEYLLVEIFPKINRFLSTFKRVLKLKDKNKALYSLLCMIIDQFNTDPRKDEKGEYKYTLLLEHDIPYYQIYILKGFQVFIYLLEVNITIKYIQAR